LTVGFKKNIPFLDGSQVKVTSKKGQYVSNGDRLTVKGKGMPFFKRETQFGNLHIEFEVEYPKASELSEEVVETLNKVSEG
jgi:DnaJ-class molecular chaperone